MRLSLLSNIVSTYDSSKSRLEYNYNNQWFNNVNEFKNFIEYIKPLDFYHDEISFLLKSDLYKTTNDEVRFSDEGHSREVRTVADYLIESFRALKIALPKLVPSSNENSIDIKLPKPTDLDSLNQMMLTIEKTLSQVVVNNKIKGSVKVGHWEYGSFWIELMLATPAAVSLVAGIAWSAAVVSKKWKEVKIFEEQARALQLKNDSMEDILKAQRALTSDLIENEANGLLAEHFDSNDNEQRERIKYAIKEFSTLIQNGAEVHPSLMSPETVQNLFPDYGQLSSIESKVTKQIEDKSE